MKLHMLLLIALAAVLAACGEKEQVAAPTESEMETAEAAAVDTSEAEAVEAVEDEFESGPDATLADIQAWRDEALLDHMHAHAEQLDDLNFALDDGDLFSASTSAYWLARHDAVKGLPESLQPYVIDMRDAAREAEAAEDIETAKAAARRIGEACQACHEATGASIS